MSASLSAFFYQQLDFLTTSLVAIFCYVTWVFLTMLILLHTSEKVFYTFSGTDMNKELALIKTKMIEEFDKKRRVSNL